MQKLSWETIESNAIVFSKKWKNCRGTERQEAQKFEIDLMNVFGVDFHEGLHEYQVRDAQGKIGYIDYLLPGKILIEMKSKGESLVRAYNQGYDYTKCLTPDEYPELLLVSNFDYIQVTNLKTMQTFKKFKVSQLKNRVRMLGLLAGYNSEVTFKTNIEVNTDASYKMAKLHDILKENGYEGENLEVYLVRLLFCLFAEDTGIFEERTFEQYIKNSKEDGSDLSSRIMMLFSILDTPENKRMTNLPEELKRFRYINGKLFAKPLPPAYFDNKTRQILIDCCDFDWSYISPAIFGAMFQGVMNPKERHDLGAHYTSEENILKLIKTLFLDELWEEFEKSKSTKAELEAFHNKLANLNFLDPACGCGNFLIITYRELRLIEFEVLKMLYDNRQLMIIDTFCKVSIEQFYGIEYEEFPCQIAQVGLLLMKHQLDKEVSNYFGMNIIDFPIRETANIVFGNALRIDWEEVITKDKCSYIIGNPPFLGKTEQSKEQKSDMSLVFEKTKGIGDLDYVASWYYKSAKYIQGTRMKIAFVSTNSITQGEQASILWKPLIQKFNIIIDFAYRTFVWSNDAKGKAKVHCVIIGFSCFATKINKRIYMDDNSSCIVKNIHPYLIDSPNIVIESRNTSLCDVAQIKLGNKLYDKGGFILSDEEKDELLEKEPLAEKWIRKFVSGSDFINNKNRWCLWLKNAERSEIKRCPTVMKRIEYVRNFRSNSVSKATQKLAETPTLFCSTLQPDTDYVLIPRVSTQRRRYVPMGYMSKDVILNDTSYSIEDANLYLFGVLNSDVHMAWMRTVAGRIKSDYRYGKDTVYNTFPWPTPTEKQKERIEKCAQAILDARALYPDSSLADLYDPLFMPSELLKAHKNLDKEVSKAYGKVWETEEECVAYLMKMYQKLVDSN
ncbi:DNA methyltransferase [Bacillus mycoides]|uniref:DNA methyltransferase n=1 Tax=Bacillus mycoides TaxID=1405 RepID=UPI0024ADC684|nr:DNA methyltransferase [Bacillus mycoides]MDI6533354.1 class I SAM-dependent DNA methyltransferase [Bacillus mycoides]MED1059664.1 class I SAM-dependent DNA methyltransferase [Bacillus mycoides]WJE60111.1 class I SAM-dependent DNA methyltransferase [Bacillus mycoides]